MTSNERQITMRPVDISEGRPVPVASCSCGAIWEGDGDDGLGNTAVPDDTPGIMLEAWEAEHVCLDQATMQRFRDLFRTLTHLREELLPTTSHKVTRLSNAASHVVVACLYGSPFVLEALESMEEWCSATEDLLKLLDKYLNLDEDESAADDPPPDWYRHMHALLK